MSYQLPDLAIRVILRDWHLQTYRPPYTDVREWIRSIEMHCNLYGIPDVQRLRCAESFINAELRIVLTVFEPLDWNRLKAILIPIDQHIRREWKKLPLYKKHPKYTAAALGVVGGIVLTPVAAAALSYVGLTTAATGVATGSALLSYQSIVYSSATRVFLMSLQSAGTATITPSIGTLLTGAATTGTGILVATTNAQSETYISSEILQQAAESLADSEKPGDDDGDDGNPPPYRATDPEEYRLTPRAILAIIKSWDAQTYKPPKTNCTTWLSDVHNFCEQYGIPIPQRASCAMHHISAGCKEAALDAGCCNMTWDEFTVWLHQYDHQRGTSANEKTMGLLAKRSKAFSR